jgi:N4-gp56 family major capsid protein
MATTSYGVNDNLAVKLWAKKLFAESLKQTVYSELMGTGSDSVIQIRNEMNKSEGDRVRIGLRMQLTGDGVAGDGTLEGNEEALATYYDDVFIDQLRHAVRSAGKMSEQRVPFSVRNEARMGLQDWWADRLDTWFFNQVCGNTAITDTRYCGMQATVAPTASTNWIYTSADHTTDATLDNTDKFDSLSYIDTAVVLAKTNTPAIRPAKIRGQQLYVLFMHPLQVRDLRQASSGQTWMDIQRALVEGGFKSEKDSPIYKGGQMVGIYNGCLILESTRVPYGVSATSTPDTDTRRAVLCGAQSAAFAYGQKQGATEMSWVEELFDYENQLGVSAGMIAGLTKLTFNSKDFGTVVLSSYAA